MSEQPEGAKVVKRSLTIAGHRTSVSLEDAFWDGLREVAARLASSPASLVAEIDRRRGAANLSSAIRVFVLDHASRASQSTAEPRPPGLVTRRLLLTRSAGSARRIR